jgi:hypothetical protein
VSYQGFIDDNGAYQDVDARVRGDSYATAEEAIAACKQMVDDDLKEVEESGMSGGDILKRWKLWGRDPFIAASAGSAPAPFSAWSYAEVRAPSIWPHRPAPPLRTDQEHGFVMAYR